MIIFRENLDNQYLTCILMLLSSSLFKLIEVPGAGSVSSEVVLWCCTVSLIVRLKLLVNSLFHPNEFALLFPGFRFMELAKVPLRGYSCTMKWRRVKAIARQMIVDKSPAPTEDTSSDESSSVEIGY